MNKTIFITLCCGLLFFTGCENSKKEIVDYSQYHFTGKNWTRNGENDIETIRFNIDGSFRYSCGCGNPVNDADLCETYTYNEETKEIKLECFEKTEDTITTIKIINSTDTTLEFDFNGEVRTFEKE